MIIETDAQLVRDAYSSEGENDSVFCDLVMVEKIFLRDNPSYSVKWVCRKANC